MHSYTARDGAAADGLWGRAARLSHYAARLLAAEPGLRSDTQVERAFAPADMRAALAADAPSDEETLKRALRRLRQRVMLNLIARDLGGVAPLAEVVATATALAEVTTAYALERLDGWLRQRHGPPTDAAGQRAQHLHVVGMG